MHLFLLIGQSNMAGRGKVEARDPVHFDKPAGILWHQGESDSGKPEIIADYPERLDAMAAQLRKDLGAEKVPFVMGELIHDHANHHAPNVGLAKAAEKVANSEFLIRQENGLAHFRQIDTPHGPTTRRSFRPMGAAHTSPRQRLGNTPCDTRAF
jgi:hypothetical protein